MTWKNTNVLFCHSDIDDAGIPHPAFRLLLHLQRRVGKRTKENANLNPGIDSMAKTCRMEQQTVVRYLRWLETNGYIEITKAGRANHYKVLVSRRKLYIHKDLDDYGLTSVQMRAVAHMVRLCGDNIGKTTDGIAQMFCINKSKFAKVCGVDAKTLAKAMDYLEEQEFYGAYSLTTNPVYCLSLDEKFGKKSAA
jgi:DNA-binding MarR family transcriptional regulator